MRRLTFVVASAIVCPGCKEVDPVYCANPAHAGDPLYPDATTSDGGCRSSADCVDNVNLPACDMMGNGGTCVQCTMDDHVLHAGTTPLCKNDSCATCVQDIECGTGGLCLPNGACAAAANTIHAATLG